jgi:hypothetical protein
MITTRWRASWRLQGLYDVGPCRLGVYHEKAAIGRLTTARWQRARRLSSARLPQGDDVFARDRQCLCLRKSFVNCVTYHVTHSARRNCKSRLLGLTQRRHRYCNELMIQDIRWPNPARPAGIDRREKKGQPPDVDELIHGVGSTSGDAPNIEEVDNELLWHRFGE